MSSPEISQPKPELSYHDQMAATYEQLGDAFNKAANEHARKEANNAMDSTVDFRQALIWDKEGTDEQIEEHISDSDKLALKNLQNRVDMDTYEDLGSVARNSHEWEHLRGEVGEQIENLKAKKRARGGEDVAELDEQIDALKKRLRTSKDWELTQNRQSKEVIKNRIQDQAKDIDTYDYWTTGEKKEATAIEEPAETPDTIDLSNESPRTPAKNVAEIQPGKVVDVASKPVENEEPSLEEADNSNEAPTELHEEVVPEPLPEEVAKYADVNVIYDYGIEINDTITNYAEAFAKNDLAAGDKLHEQLKVLMNKKAEDSKWDPAAKKARIDGLALYLDSILGGKPEPGFVVAEPKKVSAEKTVSKEEKKGFVKNMLERRREKVGADAGRIALTFLPAGNFRTKNRFTNLKKFLAGTPEASDPSPSPRQKRTK